MRSPVPLIRSILMDVVKKSDRSKWNAVERFHSIFFSFISKIQTKKKKNRRKKIKK